MATKKPVKKTKKASVAVKKPAAPKPYGWKIKTLETLVKEGWKFVDNELVSPTKKVSLSTDEFSMLGEVSERKDELHQSLYEGPIFKLGKVDTDDICSGELIVLEDGTIEAPGEATIYASTSKKLYDLLHKVHGSKAA